MEKLLTKINNKEEEQWMKRPHLPCGCRYRQRRAHALPQCIPPHSLSRLFPSRRHSLSHHRTRISPSPTTLCSPCQLIKGAINQAQHSVFCACHAIWKSKRASSTNWSSRFAADREAYLSVRAYVTHTHVINYVRGLSTVRVRASSPRCSRLRERVDDTWLPARHVA